MKITFKTVYPFLLLAVGAVLLILRGAGVLQDFWGGFGSGLIGLGALYLIQRVRYRIDGNYAKRVDVESHDERLLYLSNKAKSWTFSGTVLLLVVGIILFQLRGETALMLLCNGILCAILVLYLVCYIILRHRG